MGRTELINILTEFPKIDKIKFYKSFGHELSCGIRRLSVQKNNGLNETLDSIGILSELLKECFNWIYELENNNPFKWFDLDFSELIRTKLAKLPLAHEVVEKALDSSLEFISNSANIRCQFCKCLLAKENPQTDSHIPTIYELIEKGRVAIHGFGWFCDNKCKEHYEVTKGREY